MDRNLSPLHDENIDLTTAPQPSSLRLPWASPTFHNLSQAGKETSAKTKWTKERNLTTTTFGKALGYTKHQGPS
jgi:hypothetical protein